MASASLSAFKDLIATIEKSKNLIKEHELLSDEELCTLKQTSSLVAKFQKEALAEKENRVLAELLAKEKDRLVSDAWKIVSALKKDKYALEVQLERLKSNKPVERHLSNKRFSGEHTEKHAKYSPKRKNTVETDNKEQSQTASEENTGLSSDGLKTGRSSDSKEKQDSVKESIGEDFYCAKDLTAKPKNAIQLQEMYSTGNEDEEIDMEKISSDATNDSRGNSFKHYSPSDMIKLWTVKPFVSRRYEGRETNIKEVPWYEGRDGVLRCTEKTGDFKTLQQTYTPHIKDKFLRRTSDHLQDFKEDYSFPSISSMDDTAAHDHCDSGIIKPVRSSSCHDDAMTYNTSKDNKINRSESIRKSLGKWGRETNNKDFELYGRHAPKKASPLMHSMSSSNEVRHTSVRSEENSTVGNKRKKEKPVVKKLSKKDSHAILNTSPNGLPGGIVSKRIQDLAKRLKIGHSTARSKKKEATPDSMDLRNPCPGLCGLENLGNSCFVNAGLQCLFVIKPFYRFFLEGGHLNLLKNNSKTQQSKSLSVLLGRLIEKVFSGCYLTCEPSALFTALQSKFPQLNDFREHDCQEFLALFLDALHQELNTANRTSKRRIKQTESKSTKSADHWWKMYNEEHESVIVDTFQGQFRNKITCSECSHVSVTYQLFSFLSLPLVSQKMQPFVITFIHNNRLEVKNSSKPKAIRLRVQASKPSSTLQIKQRLVSLLSEDEQPDFNNLFLAVVRDSSIVGLLHDDRIVTPINDKHSKLYAFEPLHPPTINICDVNLLLNNEEITNQSHKTPRRYIKCKNTFMVPLGNIFDTHGKRKGCSWKTRASLPVGYHLTFTCSVCLQTKPSKDLLQHNECGKVFCRECLQVSSEEENVNCPDCTRPSSTGRNKNLNLKYFNVPVMFRHKEPDSEDEYTIFGHPNLVTLPYKITGEDLYRHLAVLLPVSSINKKTRVTKTLPFTLYLVNHQGRYCSRCDRLNGCTGCCLQTDDILLLQNGDHIAIQLTNIIQLEIDKMSRYADHESMRVKHLTCRLQLQDCLRSFVDREELQDLWHCPKCKLERSATKSMSVVRYPDTLIIHLKRYNQNNMKICTPVEFPLESLDMGEFMHGINSPRESYGVGDNIYDLMGCVCHDGDYEGGHYTAFTRHGIKAEWCLFDDYKVAKECPSSSSHKKVYILFYNRRSDSPLSTSIDETITLANASRQNYEKRRSLEESYKMVEPRTRKSISSTDEINCPGVITQTIQHPLEDAVDLNSTSTPKEKEKKLNGSRDKAEGVVVRKIKQNENANGVTINISQEQERPRTVTVTIDRQQEQPHRANVDIDRRQEQQEHPESVTSDIDEQQQQSAQCDCLQCDYFRELEEQIKLCRRSLNGTELKEKRGELSSASPKSLSPKTAHSYAQAPLAKNTGNDMRKQKVVEASPPLAASDSIDGELDDQCNQVQRGQYYRPSKYSPTSTSSDSITDIDADAEGSSDSTKRKRASMIFYEEDNTDVQTEEDSENRRQRSSFMREYDSNRRAGGGINNRRGRSSLVNEDDDISSESVTSKTTQLTDSAVQCTLLDEHDLEYGPDYEYYVSKRSSSNKNKVDTGVQVSFTESKFKQRKHNKTRDDQELDEEEVEFLTRKLICAVENEDIRHALQLLKEGADPSLLVDGVTAIHLSAGIISTLGFHFTRLFLDFGANPNVKSAEGVTPVHVAAMWGQKECLKLLLSKGGNPYSEDMEGHNAVELANIFENDTSAITSEYLSRLDEHYSSLIRCETLSNTSLTSQISTSELHYMPYLYSEEDSRPIRARKQLSEFIIPRHGITAESIAVPGCGSWTRRLRKKVKKNRLVRTVSGNLRRTSSRIAGRFRSLGGHFSSNSDGQRQTYSEDTDSEI